MCFLYIPENLCPPHTDALRLPVAAVVDNVADQARAIVPAAQEQTFEPLFLLNLHNYFIKYNKVCSCSLATQSFVVNWRHFDLELLKVNYIRLLEDNR